MKKIATIFIVLLFAYSCKSQVSNKTEKKEKPSIVAVINQKINESSLEEAIDWLEQNKNSDKYTFKEEDLNAFGYRLFYNLENPEQAARVFEINVKLFVESSNVHDSAGEVYLHFKEYEKSIDYYRKSIELSGKPTFPQIGYVIPEPYVATQLPKDTSKLFVHEGNWDNEIAFVYVQGGPLLDLDIGPRDGLHLMPENESLLKVYPYQAQMLNPYIIACKPILTENQSAFENAQSVEILSRVISYLVQQKKKVFLIGHSYGASLSLKYLQTKKNLANKVVLMGTDLDEDISSWDNLESGELIRWEKGETPYVSTFFGFIPEEHPLKSSFRSVLDNLGMLVRHNMCKQHTQLLKDEDYKSIISVFSTYDEANGRKSQAEIDLLTKKGSLVVEIVEGDHHGMLTAEFMTALYKHLVHGSPLAEKYSAQ